MKERRFFGKIVLFKLGGFMKNISGCWKAGWALDVHTIRSTPNLMEHLIMSVPSFGRFFKDKNGFAIY